MLTSWWWQALHLLRARLKLEAASCMPALLSTNVYLLVFLKPLLWRQLDASIFTS